MNIYTASFDSLYLKILYDSLLIPLNPLNVLDRFRQAAMAIKEEFGLSLFGFDVIVPRRSG